MLNVLIEPMEHQPGRNVVGRDDPGDRSSITNPDGTPILVGRNEPPDPVRSSAFNNYETDTGVIGNGYSGRNTGVMDNDSSKSLAYYINPFAKHGQRDFYNENVDVPFGKPAAITDSRGRVLDGRTQYPGQKQFRFMTNIPRPAYMSFSDLVDLEGVR
jgi:hypothetical protein